MDLTMANSYLSNKIQNQVHEKFRIKCLLYKDFEIEMILSDDNNLISINGSDTLVKFRQFY